MSILSFAITLIGLAWFSAATLYGAFNVHEFDFQFVLVLAHMAIGFAISLIGLCRRD